jgi:hypothetical protein
VQILNLVDRDWPAGHLTCLPQVLRFVTDSDSSTVAWDAISADLHAAGPSRWTVASVQIRMICPQSAGV